jgi:hypothetical protein
MSKKPEPRPPEVEDGKEALKRLAALTRKVVAVPKSEIPTDTRKQPNDGAG